VTVPLLLATALLLAAPAAASAPGVAPPSPERPFFERLREARRALADGDLDAARARFRALDDETRGFPSGMWALAQIAARRGDAEEAFRELETYAASGLARSLARDSSFATLAGDPRYAALAERLLANAAPSARAEVVATLPDPGLLAEDVAHDPRTGSFYVSSIHRRKIVVVDSSGAVRDFIAPAQDGVWGVFGLALDGARGLLWGSVAAVPTIERYDSADSGRTALFAWDVVRGSLHARVEAPRDGASRLLGDIALGPDGTVYATESLGGALYRLAPGADSLERIAPPGTFGSPQTPVVLDGGARLLVADYPRGIVRFDTATGTVAPIEKPRALALTGVDGLYRVEGGLVAVQNGTAPARVLRIGYDAGANRFTEWDVLEQGSPMLGEPNHGVVVGDEFVFIGRSGWERVDARESLVTGPDDLPPVLLRVRLPAPSGR
jgi:hypothetical protein